ncbi:MAG: DUF1501 domain-containing protein, partial [Planctomycetota bacterium]
MNNSQFSDRRQSLKSMACGFGLLSAAAMAHQDAAADQTTRNNAITAKLPHFTPRAKRVIFLFM